MREVNSIADIPFIEHDPMTLLGLAESDEAPDGDGDGGSPIDDFFGFGFTWVDEIWLTGENEREPKPPVRDALLLAMHAADEDQEAEALPGVAPEFIGGTSGHRGDILLEFWLEWVWGQEVEDESVTVRLSRFLDIWLPRLDLVDDVDTRAVVLVLCNPHRVLIPRPAKLPAGIPLYFATGDVRAWWDAPAGSPGLFRLVAEHWHSL